MKTFVISLARSSERRARIREQLARTRCPHQFLSAIEGRDGYGFFDGIDEQQYLVNTGRAATPGEIGCYASHLYLWNLCVALSEPLVIMEDDAELDTRFEAAIEVVRRMIVRYGFIRLQTEGPARTLRSTPIETIGEFTLSYCRRYPYGAMCYAIAPVTAAAFIRASRVLVGPVDYFIKQSWLHGCPLYALSPAVVWGGRLREESTIGGRYKARPNATLRLRRLLGKIRTKLRRGIFNLRHGSKRRHNVLQS